MELRKAMARKYKIVVKKDLDSGFPACSAEYLQGLLILLASDFAASKSLPQDLLHPIPGRRRIVVSAPSGKEAYYGPCYEGDEPAPEQKGYEHPWPPEPSVVLIPG